MNLYTHFAQQAQHTPDKPALITPHASLTFAALHAQAEALATHFQRHNIQAGDHVLVLHTMGPQLYGTVLALLKLGAVIIFPDPGAARSSIQHAAQVLPLKAVCGGWKAWLLRWLMPALRRIPWCTTRHQNGQVNTFKTQGNAAALITFTSGSTGRPKGIVRTHAFLLAQHQTVRRVLDAQDTGPMLITMPMFLLSNLAAGTTSILPAGRLGQPATLTATALQQAISAHHVTRMLVPPVVCQTLAHSGISMPTLQHIFTGGGPVFPHMMSALQACAPHATLTAVYGSTEAEPIAVLNWKDVTEAEHTAMAHGQGLFVGRPVADIQLKVVADELWVTGPHVIQHYLDPADETHTKVHADGLIWHRTGDAGMVDTHGQLWLKGRHSAHGPHSYPFSVEVAALQVRGVHRAALYESTLFYEGTPQALPALQKAFPQLHITPLANIPLDRRHNSKVDYGRLKALVKG